MLADDTRFAHLSQTVETMDRITAMTERSWPIHLAETSPAFGLDESASRARSTSTSTLGRADPPVRARALLLDRAGRSRKHSSRSHNANGRSTPADEVAANRRTTLDGRGIPLNVVGAQRRRNQHSPALGDPRRAEASRLLHESAIERAWFAEHADYQAAGSEPWWIRHRQPPFPRISTPVSR